MGRIRTIKPEFWEDEVVGLLSREARLLFIATWNLADDEGLLRWSAPYLKSSAFIFDDDIDVAAVQRLMDELVESELIHPYKSGKAKQSCAYIMGFHKHQKINRPSPSKLTPPSLQNPETRKMYGDRDGWTCHLCGGDIDKAGYGSNENFHVAIDHLIPESKGGSDYPSNLKAAHATCNKGRGDRDIKDYRDLLRKNKTAAQFRFPERFSESLIEELDESSLTEGEGEGDREKERELEGDGCCAACPPPSEATDDEPPDDGPDEGPDLPTEFVFPTKGKGGETWTLTFRKLCEYREAYPDLDIEAELRAARQWCRDHPSQQKTPGGMLGFLTRWFNRSQNRGGGVRDGPARLPFARPTSRAAPEI